MRRSRARTGGGFGRRSFVALAVGFLAIAFGDLAPTGTASGGDPPAAPAGDAGSGWIWDVQVTTAASSERRPSLTSAANGDLLVAYESTAAGNPDVMFQRSTTFGRTWSAPIVVANSSTEEAHPSIAADPISGRIFVAYQLGIVGATTIMSAYSDDGVSWTAVTAFSCGVLCERPRIVSEYWNGASNRQYIVFAGEVSAGTDWNWVVVRSVDQGAVWTPMYESGFSAIDVRHHPAIAVQHGTDGTDRVMVFYRSGAAVPGTTGTMEWSEDYGATWTGLSNWAANVDSPPTVAASHDGDSVMVAYATAANDVTWAVHPDPTSLVWGVGSFWGAFPNTGSNVALAVDGAGSRNLTLGGRYHLVARSSTAAEIVYATAPTNLTGAADWTVPSTVSDTAGSVSVTYPEKTVTTVLRGSTWFPGVAWGDFRDGLPDYNVYFTTPGTTYTIATSPTGLQVTIDGNPATAPVVLTWFPGEIHAIGTPSPQLGAPGTRSTFQSWSDGGTQSHFFTVGTADITITATFLEEVFLAVSSAHSGVSGSGWYALGATATIAAISPQPGPPGTRFVFAAWTGDILSASNPASVSMDAPKAIVANWRTEYELTIASAHGNVSGGGWYPAGDAAQVTLAEREVTEGGRTWQFTGWSGDATGTNATANVTMDGARTVTANWREKPGLLVGAGATILLLLILVVALIAVLGLVFLRRRKKPQPTFQQMHTVPGAAAPVPSPPPVAPPEPPQEWPPPTGPAP